MPDISSERVEVFLSCARALYGVPVRVEMEAMGEGHVRVRTFRRDPKSLYELVPLGEATHHPDVTVGSFYRRLKACFAGG